MVGISFLELVEVVNLCCLKATLERCEPLGLEPPVAWIQDNAPNPFLTSTNILLFAVNNGKLQQTVTAVDTQSISIKITNIILNFKYLLRLRTYKTNIYYM